MVTPVDIHIHLVDNYYTDLSVYLKTYIKLSDSVFVSVPTDIVSSLANIDLAKEFPGKVFPFIGVHPQMADYVDMDSFAFELEKMKDYAFGIGEIGLDRKAGSDQILSDSQKKVFTEQLSVAEKIGKPVAIHTRGTLKEILEILTSYKLKNVLLHWFTCENDELKQVSDSGYYTSFGPAIIGSKRKMQIIKSLPKEYILVETDGPVRFGGCFEGKTALPTFLYSVIFSLTNTLDMSYENVLELLFSNSEQYLSIDLSRFNNVRLS